MWTMQRGIRPTKTDRDTDRNSRKWTSMIHCEYLEGRKWNQSEKTAASAHMR